MTLRATDQEHSFEERQKRYSVNVCRLVTYYEYASVEIEADSPEEAEAEALRMRARDFDWDDCGEHDYNEVEVQDVEEVD